jgi:Rieske Fe-S protein
MGEECGKGRRLCITGVRGLVESHSYDRDQLNNAETWVWPLMTRSVIRAEFIVFVAECQHLPCTYQKNNDVQGIYEHAVCGTIYEVLLAFL